MAVQYRKDKGKWRCYWRNPFSKRIESKSFETELEAKKYDSLVKHRLRYEQESFFKDEEPKATQSGMTLEQLHFLYLRDKRFNDKGLAWQLSSMRRIHAMIGGMQIADIDYPTLERVKERELADSSIKTVTAREHLAILRAILRWGVEKQYLDAMPLFPRMPDAHCQHIVPPTPEEMDRIYAAAAPHLQRVILIACNTGVRVGQSELFGIRWSDVDLLGAVLRLRAARKNPGEPVREIPLRESIIPILTQWLAEDSAAGIDYVIHFGGKPIKSIKTAWQSALKRAGITRRIRPYDQRHMFGSECVAAGIDIGTVARLMGHSSPVMLLKHYQHVSDPMKRAAVEALPDIRTVCPEKYARKKTV